MLQAVSGFPRLETQLYLDWSGPPAFLKVGTVLILKNKVQSFFSSQPKVSSGQVAVYKKQIYALIEKQRVAPQARINDFKK